MGHSKSLYMLSTTMMLQSFTYILYTGMLVMFMIEVLHFSNSFATYLYGIAIGATYFFQILGGYLCDNYLGNRKAVMLGMLLITVSLLIFTYDASLYNIIHVHSHSTLLFSYAENIFLIGACFMAFGVSFFKVSITSFVNLFYKDNEEALDSAFSLFYMFLNIGGFFAPLTISFVVGVHHPELYQNGFLIAFVVMLIGLLLFIALKNRFLVLPDGEPVGVVPTTKLKKLEESKNKLDEHKKNISNKLSKIEIDRTKVIVLMLIAVTIYNIAYHQTFTSLILFIENCVHKSLPILHYHLAPSAFLTLNPIFVILLTPVQIKLFDMLAKRNRNVSSIAKIGLGLFMIFVSFAVLALIFAVDDDSIIHMLWLVVFYFLLENAELLIMPVSMSLISKLAPEKYISSMIGIYYFIFGIASILGGYFASAFPLYGATKLMNIIPIPTIPAFLMSIAVLSIVSAIIWFLLKGKIVKWAHGVE